MRRPRSPSKQPGAKLRLSASAPGEPAPGAGGATNPTAVDGTSGRPRNDPSIRRRSDGSPRAGTNRSTAGPPPQIVAPPPTATVVLAVGERLLAVEAEEYVKGGSGAPASRSSRSPASRDSKVSPTPSPDPAPTGSGRPATLRTLPGPAPSGVPRAIGRSPTWVSATSSTSRASTWALWISPPVDRWAGRATIKIEYTQLNADEVVSQRPAPGDHGHRSTAAARVTGDRSMVGTHLRLLTILALQVQRPRGRSQPCLIRGEAAEVFLREAEVVELEEYDTKGITEPRKATLTNGELTLDAVFKDVDKIHPKM